MRLPRSCPLLARSRAPRRARLWAAAGTLLCVLAWGLPAQAASFQVSPTRFVFPLEERFTNYFTVTNNSPDFLRVRVTTAFLDTAADGGLVPVEHSPYDLGAWIVINPRRLSMGPSEKRVVRFSVRPPAGLAPGEYRTVVFFEELPPRPGERAGDAASARLQILTRIGVTIYGQVGEAAPQLRLDAPELAVEAQQVRFAAMLHNAGSGHATVDIAAAIRDGTGAERASLRTRVTVQRAQKRPLELRLERPAPGDYILRVTGTMDERTAFETELPFAVKDASP